MHQYCSNSDFLLQLIFLVSYIVSSPGINDVNSCGILLCYNLFDFSFFSISPYSMKQDEKPFTSSLNICPKACCRYVRPPPLKPPPYFLADLWIFHLKDDVTVILLFGVSSMPSYGNSNIAFVLSIPNIRTLLFSHIIGFCSYYI